MEHHIETTEARPASIHASKLIEDFNPQPDPPGKPHPTVDLNPQPEPPGRRKPTEDFNPQPDPPGKHKQ